LAERDASRTDAGRRGVLMLFLDGVGLGDADPEGNPLAAATLPSLRELIGGAPVAAAAARTADGVVFRSLDARLGHAGLPQSATGQTSLLTGRNAAELMGRHYGPWPGPTLVRALQDGTLFHHAGGAAALANAYPEGYFRAVERRRLRPNAPVTAARAAEVRLFDLDDYRDGAALAADITGLAFQELDPDLPRLTPEEAGRRLARLAGEHAFTFYDVWLTDRFDGLIAGMLPALGETTLVLTSDHGNVEDLTSSRHTLNPVPLLAVGPGAEAFSAATDLMDVYGGVRQVLARA
jgi:2,3-bisphosphoglycerate-independent phosphoglycerate mutase